LNAAVIGGSALFGIADPTFVAIAKEQGIDGCVIGSVVNSVPFWALTKNPNVPQITNAAMLAPYSVATFSAPSTCEGKIRIFISKRINDLCSIGYRY